MTSPKHTPVKGIRSGQSVGSIRRRNHARCLFAQLCRRVRGVDLKVAKLGAIDDPGRFRGEDVRVQIAWALQHGVEVRSPKSYNGLINIQTSDAPASQVLYLGPG